MVRLILALVVLTAISCLESLALAQDTPKQGSSAAIAAQIAKDLADAKRTYQSAMDVARAPILEKFDELDDRARTNGNVELVEKLKKEREQFIDKGILVGRLSKADQKKMSDYKVLSDRAKSEMTKAYDTAIKKYLMAREDDIVTKVKIERDEFQKGQLNIVVPVPRRSFQPFRVVQGQWRFEKDELVPAISGWNRISFGEPEWIDYDIQFKAKVSEHMPHGFFLSVHGNEKKEYQQFCIAVDGNNHFRYEYKVAQDNINNPIRFNRSIELDRWHDVSVKIRGADVRVLLDGEEVLKASDERFVKGQIVLMTINSSAHFKELKILTPTGEPLWEAVPSRVR